jgi:hypothetical protein
VDSQDNYQHPGRLFVARHGQVSEASDVVRYAEFLRRESGLGDEPPIDLAPILRRFGILPKRVSLPGQAGLLVNPDSGVIFISSDDPAARQRFSEAHELMELLFSTRSRTPSWSARSLFSDTAKEKLCEVGAAELLMPLSTFKSYVYQWGVSLETGQRLAKLYDVSLTASLLRTVRYGPGYHALVLWRMAHKPTEEQTIPHPGQLCLFKDYTPQSPPRKLRVWWGCSMEGGPYIPPHKSAEYDTSIYRVYELGTAVKDLDWIDLGSFCGRCFCESMAVNINGEKCVLSVVHMPEDEHSVTGCQSPM